MSEEVKKLSGCGVKRSPEWRAKISAGLRRHAQLVGYKHTCEVCGKRLRSNNLHTVRCKRHRIFTEEHRLKLSLSGIGKKQSKETLEKLSKIRKGKTAWNKGKPGLRGSLANNWQGGKNEISKLERGRLEMAQWRLFVFERDNFTCQECGIRGQKLNAHHKYPFAKYKEKRLDNDNGITLCLQCHRKIHKLYSGKDYKWHL